MKPIRIRTALLIFLGIGAAGYPGGMIETPQGVAGYQDTPLLDWCGYIKHDPNRPQPVYVDPGPAEVSARPPSDAIILFDTGQTLSCWEPGSWQVAEDVMEAGQGDLASRQAFGDCQLHLEFMIPQEPKMSFMNRGNSGVFLMGLYEIQIFDSHPSHKRQLYADGQCAAVYGDTPPLVNACRPAGQWQTYDILFTGPVFEKDKVIKPAAITMFHNGVLVHYNTIIHGPTGHQEILTYQPHPDKLPLKLQGHGCPVRFRNIWIRPLDRIHSDSPNMEKKS
jgi:hypothetical protein